MSRPAGGQTLAGSNNSAGSAAAAGGGPPRRATSAAAADDRAARAAAAEQRAAAQANRGAPKGPGKIGRKLAEEQAAGGTGGHQGAQLPERQVVRLTVHLFWFFPFSLPHLVRCQDD